MDKPCANYCGVTCVDGSCPNADDFTYDRTDCVDCFYNNGCDDCYFCNEEGRCTIDEEEL